MDRCFRPPRFSKVRTVNMHHLALVLAAALLFRVNRVGILSVSLIATTLITFAAIYGDASWDYEGYLQYYECLRDDNCGDDANRLEPGFLLLASAIDFIWGAGGGAILIAIYSAVAALIKLYVLRKECRPFGVALLGYLCFGWFIHDMTQIRVGL